MPSFKEIAVTKMSFSRSFSRPDQILFFQNFSAMSAAGLSIVGTLEVLREQAPNKTVEKAINAIIMDVQNGQRLSLAMSKFPKLFPTHLVETINIGEQSGELRQILDRIVFDLEKTNELRKKIVSAIAYPVVVIVVMLLVVAGLIIYVLPRIVDLYRELGANLPLATRVLVGLGSFLEKFPFVIPGLIILFIIGYFLVKRYERSLYIAHSIMLRLPVFGQFIKEYNLVKLFRTIETLFKSGMSLVYCVDIAKKTTSNRVFRRALDSVNPILINGGHLSTALKPYPFLFPLQTIRMIEVGERTGRYQDTFRHLANFYEKSVNHKSQIMTSLIEPILMVLIAIVVGGLALTVFLPIYRVANIF